MDSQAIVTKALEANSESQRKLEGLEKRRSAFPTLEKVVAEKEYVLGITGLRGIGKTVLLLQLAKAFNGVYFSADDRNLRGVDLYDIIKALSAAGHDRLFIDEIHSKPNWDSDLKTAYDEGLSQVTFTGSSAIGLKITKADLSRRMVLERLKPASFREWLWIKKGAEVPENLSTERIVKEKAILARNYGGLRRHLPEYCKNGGILYDAGTYFEKTVLSSIETIATKDFAFVSDVDSETADNFFKLLRLVAISKPMELSYSTIGEALGKSKVWVMRFLENVEKTEAIRRIYSCGSGIKPIRKEAKYYLPFPYRSALCESSGTQPDTGSLREEFFANHAENCCFLKTDPSAKTADFMLDGKTFEIGGKAKGNAQGADYLAVDSLDTSQNRVPLMLFGFLY